MRRAPTALVACLLLMAATGSVSSQTPSASPEMAGHRIEVPDAGVALTLPAGWEWDLRLDGPPPPVDPAARFYGWPILDARQSSLDLDPSLVPTCAVAFTGMRDTEWLEAVPLSEQVEAFGASAVERLRLDSTYETAVLDLVVGPVARLDITSGEPASGVIYRTEYYYPTLDGHFVLSCESLRIEGKVDRPDDHWLSIAETLEFLPHE